ncbi:glycoside hydrolase family 31 protein [Methylovirgula sp. 4M-Z18]|uniref:glycoside hydrolase family 31 protein n=1 Tax=Methylovirgula sp. 4M-Z18 TaxID=2293567 RepID=UPI000E2FE881|nr:TIM-barrel domain-containing protein [Methylovirgula sp. 4M-Z18]RFB78917.1 DUF4968 domain-containing protein [Methylovirgula sp. 4M-Z18]
MRPIRDVVSASALPSGIELVFAAPFSARIRFLKPDLARVSFLRDGAAQLSRSWAVLPPGEEDCPWNGFERFNEAAWPTVAVEHEESETKITLQTEAIRLVIAKAPFRLSWHLPNGTCFAQDRDVQPYFFNRRRPGFRHAMKRTSGDRMFGAGDKTGPLDLSGRRLRLAMRDALGYDPKNGDPLYKNWPFLIARDAGSGTSYGLFYDNYTEGAFDLGCEHDNYFGLYRSYEAEDGDLDYYLFLGPKIADVTPKFLALTGRTPRVPRWSLGFALTAMALADAPNAQTAIAGVIDEARRHAIPVASFHFGSGYTSIGPKRYVFHWNREKFPDPKALTAAFAEAGIKVVANVKPCLLDDHPNYREAAAASLFITDDASGTPLMSQFWDGEGAYLDFLKKDAVDWWRRGIREALLDMGIAAAWNDNNEYELWDEGATCGHNLPLTLTRPLQALLMTRASRDEQIAAAPDAIPFTITRAGCPGLQRYAQTWSGDNVTSWDSLKWNLRTGLTMSLSGMYNVGHDVGGFAGPPPDAELLIRWTQVGALHPRFIMNSWKPGGVYNSPWLHPQAIAPIRNAIRLRLALMPYLYALMHAAHAEHVPVLRPLFWQFEADAASFMDTDALILGPALMAIPATAPGTRSVTAYLPKGPSHWFDFYDERVLPSGSVARLEAPLDRLALAVPAGGILPLADGRHHDAPTALLRVFPGAGTGESRFTIVEDDGISMHGPRSFVHVRLEWNERAIKVGARVEGDYLLPYETLSVRLPVGETRDVMLSGEGVELVLKET